MRLCIVGHEYPPNVISGPGRYALNLVRELEKRGHEITVITPMVRGGKIYEKTGNVEIYRLKIKQSRILDKILPNFLDIKILFSMRLRGFFKKFSLENYDLLHILDMHDSYFLNKKITENVPVIISANDYYSLETSWNILKFPYFCTDIIPRYFHYNITKIMNKRNIKRAARVISDTRYTAKSVNRNADVPKEKIDVIYKGVDIKGFGGRKYKGKYQNNNILYVGSNMERKGVTDILNSMPKILERFPNTTLTIIGRASVLYRRKLRIMIANNGLKDSVKIINSVSADKIKDYYESAHVFILAPVIEDLAQVLLEAMATRTPVVCTDVGANPEGIINDETGFLVKPRNPEEIADAVIRIFDDPKLAESMGARGRKRTEDIFNSGRMLKETMKVYEKLIGGV